MSNCNYCDDDLQLMDLSVLDEGSLQFSYGVLAASILYHFGDELTTFQASGRYLYRCCLLSYSPSITSPPLTLPLSHLPLLPSISPCLFLSLHLIPLPLTLPLSPPFPLTLPPYHLLPLPIHALYLLLLPAHALYPPLSLVLSLYLHSASSTSLKTMEVCWKILIYC